VEVPKENMPGDENQDVTKPEEGTPPMPPSDSVSKPDPPPTHTKRKKGPAASHHEDWGGFTHDELSQAAYFLVHLGKFRGEIMRGKNQQGKNYQGKQSKGEPEGDPEFANGATPGKNNKGEKSKGAIKKDEEKARLENIVQDGELLLDKLGDDEASKSTKDRMVANVEEAKAKLAKNEARETAAKERRAQQIPKNKFVGSPFHIADTGADFSDSDSDSDDSIPHC
jgi:hypothetical protein